VDMHVRHCVAEDLVVEVARSEQCLYGPGGDAHRGPKCQGLLWAQLCGVGDVAATEDHSRVARRGSDPLQVSVSVLDRKVPNAIVVLVGATVPAARAVGPRF